MAKPHGNCALTGEFGKFVDAHILPKALTRPSLMGAPLMQSTDGEGFKKRFSSWYDRNLVTADGEKILRDIDTAAISLLRELKLVWSGWDELPEYQAIEGDPLRRGVRQPVVPNPDTIWQFFISICWRASASTLRDLEHFVLDKQVSEKMRQCVVSRSYKPEVFPVTLTQIVTKGEAHNQTPTLDRLESVKVRGFRTKEHRIARIYVEGLIAHIYIDSDLPKGVVSSPQFLGGAQRIVVPCIPFEVSAQVERVQDALARSFGYRNRS